MTLALCLLFLNVGYLDEQESLASLVPVADPDARCTRNIDWAALPDAVVAWVSVPGTAVDSPVAQATPDAPNAFLKRDALGGSSYGTPYIDCDCSLDSPFIVVYGHHMSDGSVFADLAQLSDASCAQEHGRIHLCQRDRPCIDLDVMAVDVVNANRERIVTTFNSGEEQEAYLERTLGECDLTLSPRDPQARTFAFVTCSYQTRNSRTVVYATA